MLSQRLQRNIRQGNVIHLHAVQCSVNAPNSGNLDLGGAISGVMSHAPATKNSAKAWRNAFAVWRKQKSLKVGGVGPMVRYDDFEVGWNAQTLTGNRTSTLYAGGMNDGATERVVIYGASTEGDDVSLEDIYESLQPQATPSRFPIGNAVVKEPKFTEEFPPAVETPLVASWSTTDPQAGHDSGAQIQAPKFYIQDTASLCGVVHVQGKLLPENTAGHVQDDLTLTITLTVSIGTPLVRVLGKRKSARRTSGAKGGRRAKGRRKK